MAAPSTTSVVIPAFNEAASIASVIEGLKRAATWHEILVIDDGSEDDTGPRSQAAGARVVRHPYNKGNGAAVKSGIRAATGEFVLILDADGQHRTQMAPQLVDRLGEYDLVVAARPEATQASLGRRLGNRLLARLASALAGHKIPDLTSGFRAARRAYLLQFIHLLPNGFSTPTTTTLSFLRAGYNVKFETVDADARVGQSKIRFARDGVKFFLILLRVITIFSPFRIFLPVSVVCLALGLGYAVWTIATQLHVTNSSVLLIVLGVFVFLLGLVSEQISSLRAGGRDHP